MTPKITVLMAAYNAENFIEKSIKSIVDQTFTDFELLIINDGSSDKTVEIAKKFDDSRIRIIENDKNRGLVYTRNKGLKEALGEYIAILDSDDVAVKNRLELQYNFLLQYPEVVLCGGHAIAVDHDGKQIPSNLFTMPHGQEEVKMQMLFLNTFVNSTVMFRALIVKELGGYRDYAPAEDYELFTRIAEKYPIDNLDTVLVEYRIHHNNTSKLQSDLGDRNVRRIKSNQLTYLNIVSDNAGLADILFSISVWDFNSFKFSDYLYLFRTLKMANIRLCKYPREAFEKKLFQFWANIIITKGAKMNALILLMNRNLFKWSFMSGSQFRKALKLSIKNLGRYKN